MTANPFAPLLAGVPRYGTDPDNCDGFIPTPNGAWLDRDEVLAALAAAVPADLAEAGKVVEGVTPGKWEPHHHDDYSELAVYHPEFTGIGHVYEASDANFIAWCREGVPALLARIAAQEAQIAHLRKTQDGHFNQAMANGSAAQHERARANAAETALAAMTKERDDLANANYRQASCIHVVAANLGPNCSATVDGLPKAARHVAAERDALLLAAQGLVEVLDQNETKGPLPDTALMFCWLAAQNVRAVLRGIVLEKPE